MDIYIWLVVDLPLWKRWVRQLGWWNSQYMESHKSYVPVTTNQIHYKSINGGWVCWEIFRTKWWMLQPCFIKHWRLPHLVIFHIAIQNMDKNDHVLFYVNHRHVGNCPWLKNYQRISLCSDMCWPIRIKWNRYMTVNGDHMWSSSLFFDQKLTKMLEISGNY